MEIAIRIFSFAIFSILAFGSVLVIQYVVASRIFQLSIITHYEKNADYGCRFIYINPDCNALA